MQARSMFCGALAAVVLAAAAVHAQADAPGSCPRDSKLLNGGPTAVYGEGPGTWWGLVAAGWDKNQNGYVCAFELRGTRAYTGDPLIDTTSFGVSDDKVAKK